MQTRPKTDEIQLTRTLQSDCCWTPPGPLSGPGSASASACNIMRGYSIKFNCQHFVRDMHQREWRRILMVTNGRTSSETRLRDRNGCASGEVFGNCLNARRGTRLIKKLSLLNLRLDNPAVILLLSEWCQWLSASVNEIGQCSRDKERKDFNCR